MRARVCARVLSACLNCVWSYPCHVDYWPWEIGACSQNLYETAPKKFQKSSVVHAATVMQVKTIDIVSSHQLVFILCNSGNVVKLTQLNEWFGNELHET